MLIRSCTTPTNSTEITRYGDQEGSATKQSLEKGLREIFMTFVQSTSLTPAHPPPYPLVCVRSLRRWNGQVRLSVSTGKGVTRT